MIIPLLLAGAALAVTPAPAGAVNVSSNVPMIVVGRSGALLTVTYFKARDNAATLRMKITSQSYSASVDTDVSNVATLTEARLLYELPAPTTITNTIDVSNLTYIQKSSLTAPASVEITGKMAYIIATQDATLTLRVVDNAGRESTKTYTLSANQAIVFIALADANNKVYVDVGGGAADVYIYDIPQLNAESATIEADELDANGSLIASGQTSVQLATVDVVGTPTANSAVTVVSVVAVV